MKKLLGLLATAVLATGLLAGCGDQTDELAKQAEELVEGLNLSTIDLDAYVTELCDYKGLELTTAPLEELTDEDVDGYIDYYMSDKTDINEVTDRAVQTGDVVNINYSGTKDGVPFEGGTAEGVDLEIGSGQFIPGFEDGVIGMNTGDKKEINVTFPEEYPNDPEMAGQPVVFHVELNQIKEVVPIELDNKFVKSLEIDDVKNVEDFKKYIKENLQKTMEADQKDGLYSQVVDYLMENSKFVETPPEELYNYYGDMIKNNFVTSARRANMELSEFLMTYYGMTEDLLNSEIATGAKESANQAMVCAKIAEAEGIEITDEELNEKIEENYKKFGCESADEYKASGKVEEYRDSLLITKVLDFVVDQANVTEVEPETETAEATETESAEEPETETEEPETATETAE